MTLVIAKENLGTIMKAAAKTYRHVQKTTASAPSPLKITIITKTS